MSSSSIPPVPCKLNRLLCFLISAVMRMKICFFFFFWVFVFFHYGSMGDDDQTSDVSPTCEELPPEYYFGIGDGYSVREGSKCRPPPPPADTKPVYPIDRDLLHVALNLEFLEAEYFLFGALGYGLDSFAPELAKGGPPPIGAQQADLDPLTQAIIKEFAYQEVDHLRAIISTVGGFRRPLLDLSTDNFAKLFDEAVGHRLCPPFNPYNNSLNYLLASYVIPYVGLTGYVGANPNILGFVSKRLLAGLLGVESGQDAVIRALLYERSKEVVKPYDLTVAEFTIRISNLRNRLGMCGIKDEGLIVPPQLGAENQTCSNILSADTYSLSYGRTPAEIFRIVYSTGNERKPGGFYPEGARGRIAEELLEECPEP